MLPPPVLNEYIHRPVMVEHSSSLDKPERSRSFYDHQMHEYESHKSNKSTHKEPVSSYSSLPGKSDRNPYSSPAYRATRPSPARTNTWTKSANHYSNDYTSSYNQRPSYNRSNSRTDFPDFAPLSSPLEIKSLTENAMKSRHISTYNWIYFFIL